MSKTIREHISTIEVEKSNLQHIAETAKINGSLLLSIEKVMKDYTHSQTQYLIKSLDAKQGQIDRLIKKYDRRVIDFKSQTQEIIDWKESMMKVHNELDLQSIGKALELPLGSSIAPQVLPRVKKLIEQNQELLEMVKYLYNFSKGRHFHSGSVTDRTVTELLAKYQKP